MPNLDGEIRKPSLLKRSRDILQAPKIAALGLAAIMAPSVLVSCTYSDDRPILGCVVDKGHTNSQGTDYGIVVDVGLRRPKTFIAKGPVAPEVARIYDQGTGVEITYTGTAEYWKDRDEAIDAAQARLDLLDKTEILPLVDPYNGELHPAATYTLKPIERQVCQIPTPTPPQR